MQTLDKATTKALVLDSLGIHKPITRITEALDTLHLFQVDSVNVFQRAHLMPAFSRIGNYSLDEFERLAFGAGQTPELREYWAHCAALIPAKDWGLFDFRRQEYRSMERVKQTLSKSNKTANWVLGELAQNGPMTISQFEHDSNKRQGSWWGWSEVKTILERMYFAGVVVSGGRTNFSRLYALPEQVGVQELNLSIEDQKLELIRRSAKALGVATEGELADYFRFYKTEARPSIKKLVQDGELVEVSLEGWEEKGYALPARPEASPYLDYSRPLRIFNPFDPLTWNRQRASRIFGFDYQIEIYTPEPKRKYGYYTLPILYRDDLVGRVDLKHERKRGELIVQSLWVEPWVSKKLIAEMRPHLIAELNLIKSWIAAEKLIPPQKGNWAF